MSDRMQLERQDAARAEQDPASGFALVAGAVGALVLGALAHPFRTELPAACFGYGFMLLTIVVAELGGSRAALVTALTSALSLNFFLTEPYLRLTIHRTDDLISFLGLAICGLVVASFRARHEKARSAARGARSETAR